MRTAPRPGPAATVLVLAVLALAAVVAVRPPHAPPLYDGLGFPDEPYRWVAPPAGATRTPGATAASTRVAVQDGRTAAAQAASAEQGPQVALSVPDGALAVPSGQRSVTLRADPRPAPSVAPDRGQVVSNLYVLTADAAGTAVPLAAGRTVLVNLRSYVATRQAVVICRWTGKRWEQVPTRQVGADIYAARLPYFGAYAAVRLDPGVSPTAAPLTEPSTGAAPAAAAGSGPVAEAPGGGPGTATLMLVLGGMVVVLVVGLLLVRRRVGGDSRAQPDAAA